MVKIGNAHTHQVDLSHQFVGQAKSVVFIGQLGKASEVSFSSSADYRVYFANLGEKGCNRCVISQGEE